MSAISSPNLTLLRSKPDTHTTVERLYCLGFPTVWTGRVNGSPSRGQQAIPFDGGAMSSGFSFGNITGGMLVFFGSSAGAFDRGRRLVLGISDATAGTLT
jgi:hypothetical protein